MGIRLRRALGFFLPVAVLATLTSGLVYLVIQQDLRGGANDPQRQLAEDAATALDGGAAPASLVGPSKVDLAHSLAPFVVIFDPTGNVLATGGQLDGRDPVPPRGVLEAARADPPNVVTWQPEPGVRVATVTVPWPGGTVLAGRSLREVEQREDEMLLLVVSAWLVTMAALAAASLIAAFLWPSPGPAREPAARG
jgi:hypothetical protein